MNIDTHSASGSQRNIVSQKQNGMMLRGSALFGQLLMLWSVKINCLQDKCLLKNLCVSFQDLLVLLLVAVTETRSMLHI